ncbi:uncharacterized protein LOC115626149 [Scaptodrosophila lebanonensis]|uniref:Uncharacterized protein LOC115626149 n=1 Tax=Drosophila lebanonensis TaxID=7225 RepID=A0A6J2TQ89_DROLE|nr:uncharacterized protein LOC115626149 [Scaptodrosophila lebanonensis]
MDNIRRPNDLARMVLGYLEKERLNRAAEIFIETSPYLKDEFNALKQGQKIHNFLEGKLEEIIREHMKITDIVNNKMKTLQVDKFEPLQALSLAERVGILMQCTASSTISINESADDRSAATLTNLCAEVKQKETIGTERKKIKLSIHSERAAGDVHKSAENSGQESKANRGTLLDSTENSKPQTIQPLPSNGNFPVKLASNSLTSQSIVDIKAPLHGNFTKTAQSTPEDLVATGVASAHCIAFQPETLKAELTPNIENVQDQSMEFLPSPSDSIEHVSARTRSWDKPHKVSEGRRLRSQTAAQANTN